MQHQKRARKTYTNAEPENAWLEDAGPENARPQLI